MGTPVFRVLGPVEAFRDGAQLALGGGRSLTLLAGLLLRTNQAVSVDSLASMLWDADLPEHPRTALASVVLRLRRTVGENVIDTVPQGYRLCVDADRLDLLRFESLVSTARDQADKGAPEKGVAALEEALALWRAPLLGNIRSAVIHGEMVPSLVERYLDAHEERAELCLSLGRHTGIVSELYELTRTHPFRERMAGQLMVAMYRSGRQADALAVYDRLRAALSDELGIDPNPAVQELYVGILRADPALGGSGPESRTPAAGCARSGKPAVVPHQLPAVAGSLYGRDAELADLDRLLAAAGSGPLLVSIVGPAGIGKTVLAVHWAHRVADRFPNGLLYLDLRGYGPHAPMTSAAALERLLGAVNADPAAVPADDEDRAGLLRSILSERRMLLVLDNARDSAHVRPLLPGLACGVVVTSRSQMRALTVREGARRLGLRPIGVAAAISVLAAVTGRPAAEFAAEQVEEVVDLCAGLPLAIRIAAERIARHGGGESLESVKQALRDRSRRLDELDTGEGDLTNMRAVMSWSYAALDPAAARAFRLLAGQPGPDIGLPAAAALLGEPPAATRRLLDRLEAAHLLDRNPKGRYALHDLLRAYGAERFWRDDPDHEAIERLYDWYTHTAINARVTLYPRRAENLIDPPHAATDSLAFGGVEAALEWFEAEYPVLVAIIVHAATSGFADHAWKAAWALWEYFYRHHLWDSWVVTHEAGLQAARRIRSRVGEAKMLDGLGVIYERKGQWRRSADVRSAALELVRQEGNRREEATILQNLGSSYYLGGDNRKSFEYLDQALRIMEGFGETPDLVIVLNNLGELMNALGRHREAIGHITRALRHCGYSESERCYSSLLDNLGVAHAGLGDHTTAMEQFRIALTHNRKYDNRLREATSLLHLGDSCAATGDHDAARVHWNAALQIRTDLGLPHADEILTRIENLERRARG